MKDKKILIIDDDLALSETLCEILRAKGYICMECHDSEGAIQIVESFCPDLIVLDYLLPSWNGGELCSAIKGLSGMENLPILIMSAYSRVLLSLGDYGCDALIEKPFNLSEFEKIVDAMILKENKSKRTIPGLKKLFTGKSNSK